MLSCEGGDKMTALKLYSTTLEAGAKLSCILREHNQTES